MLKNDLKDIERSFFEIDEANKVAKIVLKYEKPDDIFDMTCISDTPVLSAEALAYIGNAFGLVSSKYKIDLTLRFDDMGDYTEEKLLKILKKNFLLEMKTKLSANQNRNRLAYLFIVSGVLFFFAMFIIGRFWDSESIWRELFFYLFDIITTVSLYEAVTILSVEREERLSVIKDLQKRFYGIHFEKSAE